MTSVRLLRREGLAEGTSGDAHGSPLLASVPLATILEAAKSPRRKPRSQEWSRGYRTLCLLIALLVGASPLLVVGGAMAVLSNSAADEDAYAGSSSSSGGSGSGRSSSSSSSSNGNSRGSATGGGGGAASSGLMNAAVHLPGPGMRCVDLPTAVSVNASIRASGPAGSLLALALLLDEGPRGEYRRKAREALAAARSRALSQNLRLFAYEPCSVRSGVATLLAAASADAACRLGRAVVAHRCTPIGPQAAAAGQVSVHASSPVCGATRPAVPNAPAPPSACSAFGFGGGDSLPLGRRLGIANASAWSRGGEAAAAAARAIGEHLTIDGCCSSLFGKGGRKRSVGRGLLTRRKRKGLRRSLAS